MLSMRRRLGQLLSPVILGIWAASWAWPRMGHELREALAGLVVLVFAPVTFLWALGSALREKRGDEERLRRRYNNLCLKCGYDLSGSPDRCPECGDVPAKF